MKRSRGRNRKHNNNSGNRSYDSNGPDVKIRGNAATIHEKYQALARDANASGDRVRSENLLQHAEHYYRIMKAAQANAAQANPNQAAVNGHGRANGEDRVEGEQQAVTAKPEDQVEDTAEASDEEVKPQRKRRTKRAVPADKSAKKGADADAAVAEEATA